MFHVHIERGPYIPLDVHNIHCVIYRNPCHYWLRYCCMMRKQKSNTKAPHFWCVKATLAFNWMLSWTSLKFLGLCHRIVLWLEHVEEASVHLCVLKPLSSKFKCYNRMIKCHYNRMSRFSIGRLIHDPLIPIHFRYICTL